MNNNKPGAYVETAEGIMPDATDQAMAGRLHTGPALPADKGQRKAAKNEEVSNVSEK